MKKRNLLLLLLIFSITVFGQNKKILPENIVQFKIKNAGLSVEGSLKGLTGTIVFDPAKLATSSFEVSVDTKTINTGNDSRDGHLKKKDYFDVETYPKISFKSKKIEATKTGYLATGNLTIKDKTKEIPLLFTYTEKNSQGVFTSSFVLNRLDFGVGESSWILSDDVTISLNIKVVNQ
jgi:polyisoprenoid-binding protein YceI